VNGETAKEKWRGTERRSFAGRLLPSTLDILRLDILRFSFAESVTAIGWFFNIIL